MLNGYCVQLGSLVAGEGELYNITAPTDVVANEILLHATPEVMYDPRQGSLEDFYVEIGEECRLYHMTVGDIITLTEDLFTVAPTVGTLVSPQVGSYLWGTAVAGASLQGTVIEATSLGFDNRPAYAIRITVA
ncbi:MAG TPA: hypothetical protein VD651_04145, partial [Nitrosarchaeum sp.]|nr:hypothetical protein [Nitrosarchaeum sp.]